MHQYTIMESPIGPLMLVGSETGLYAIHFTRDGVRPMPEAGWQHDPAALAQAVQQLTEYFAGERRAFSLALAPQGTPFQREVWAALQTIPYGQTTSYGVLAGQLGRPSAARAVGAANGQNPLPIVIPCHRVVGSNGALTGYAGGLAIKRALLKLEGAALGPEQPTLL